MYKNICVAIDLERDCQNVIEQALMLAKANQANVKVVYVSQMVIVDTTFDMGAGNVITPGDCDINKQRMDEVVNYLTTNGVDASGELVKGVNIANALLDDVYNEYHYDLLICGSNNKTEFAEFFLGSVSSKIADKAQSDVFIVKH